MPSHYGDKNHNEKKAPMRKKKTPKGMHRMPNGKLMKGEKHNDSKPKKNTIKIGDTKITMEEGRLRKDLEMPDGKNIPMSYLKRLVKIPNGDMFAIEHGSKKMKKMSAALKKRVSLAITLKNMKK